MTATEQQRAAIETDARDALVIAGPGSGKTKVVVERVLWLVANGCDPKDIAIIVYTNNAAAEIKRRLPGVKLGFLGTLHTFCLAHIRLAGPHAELVVLTEEESDAILKRVAERAGCGKATLGALKRSRRAFEEAAITDSLTFVVKAFYRELANSGAVDFDMILQRSLLFFETNLGGGLAFEHLIVDEFQDTSRIDRRIFDLIAAANRFFVGDSDQGIFSWRGADPEAIVDMAESPQWETFRLEGNFRSGIEICVAAQRLIEHARRRVQKTTVSLLNAHAYVATAGFPTDVGEATAIARNVCESIGNGKKPADIAVLARTHGIADGVLAQLIAFDVPVRSARRLPEDWPLAIAALGVLNAPDSRLAAIRYMEARYGVKAAAEWERQKDIDGEECRILAREATPGVPKISGPMEVTLQALGVTSETVALLVSLRPDVDEPEPADLILAVADARGSLEGEGVTVTTIHGAKGGEWETVIIAGFEDEVIPGRRSNEEEERRLAYVAMTRAIRNLWITWAQHRENPFTHRMEPRTISRFALEADVND